VDYLGHTVSGNGIEMDSSKIQAVVEWLILNSLKQLRGFLGVALLKTTQSLGPNFSLGRILV